MSRMMLDNQERLVYQQMSFVERSRKARQERIRRFWRAVAIVLLAVSLAVGIVWTFCNIPLSIWDTVETVTEEVVEEVVEAIDSDTKGYYGPNPDYKNPIDTPDEDPVIWIPEE